MAKGVKLSNYFDTPQIKLRHDDDSECEVMGFLQSKGKRGGWAKILMMEGYKQLLAKGVIEKVEFEAPEGYVEAIEAKREKARLVANERNAKKRSGAVEEPKDKPIEREKGVDKALMSSFASMLGGGGVKG